MYLPVACSWGFIVRYYYIVRQSDLDNAKEGLGHFAAIKAETASSSYSIKAYKTCMNLCFLKTHEQSLKFPVSRR